LTRENALNIFYSDGANLSRKNAFRKRFTEIRWVAGILLSGSPNFCAYIAGL
jgi:hypothetical protein